jgi:hypothetical protein
LRAIRSAWIRKPSADFSWWWQVESASNCFSRTLRVVSSVIGTCWSIAGFPCATVGLPSRKAFLPERVSAVVRLPLPPNPTWAGRLAGVWGVFARSRRGRVLVEMRLRDTAR